MHPDSCEPPLTNSGPDSATAAAHELTPPGEDSESTEQAGVGSGIRFVLIPLSLVAALVALGLLLGWLVSPSVDPKELIQDLGQDERGNWRKALALANLLRDPDCAEIRRDPDVAKQLALLLGAEIDAAQMDEDRIKLRIFLCRALGEFETARALPELIRAGLAERDPAEIDVRRSAVEAIAVVVSQIGPEQVRDEEAILAMVLDAGDQFGDRHEDADGRARLRGSAAFLLGVLGGSRALERLVQLLEDPVPDVRYNAATGLARHGRAEAFDVLQEMLDPDRVDAVYGEPSAEGREWKRALVMTNAIRAVTQLAERTPSSDFGPLIVRLEHLADAGVSRPVQIEARETLHALKALQAD